MTTFYRTLKSASPFERTMRARVSKIEFAKFRSHHLCSLSPALSLTREKHEWFFSLESARRGATRRTGGQVIHRVQGKGRDISALLRLSRRLCGLVLCLLRWLEKRETKEHYLEVMLTSRREEWTRFFADPRAALAARPL